MALQHPFKKRSGRERSERQKRSINSIMKSRPFSGDGNYGMVRAAEKLTLPSAEFLNVIFSPSLAAGTVAVLCSQHTLPPAQLASCTKSRSHVEQGTAQLRDQQIRDGEGHRRHQDSSESCYCSAGLQQQTGYKSIGSNFLLALLLVVLFVSLVFYRFEY